MLIARILLALPLAGAPQGGAPVAPDVAPETYAPLWHARALWSERALAFLDELGRAPEEERARAEARVLAGRPSGAGATWYPPLELLAAAMRELTGPQSAGPLDPRRAREQGELQALADAVDLVVVPGGFAPRVEGLGEPTTVWLRAAWRPAGYGELEVRLLWRSPQGRFELARAEPATVEALRAGFAMYVRPPCSGPGSWQLVPELGRSGLTALGVGVRVDCAAGFAGPLGVRDPGAGTALLERSLAELRAGGARSLVALGPLESFELLAGRDAGGPRPLATAFEPPGRGPHALWGCLPARPPELALLILCADQELADLPLAGAPGERWRALAERRGALLLAVHAPAPGAGRTTREVVVEARAAARALGLAEGAPLVAVARGAAAARLGFEPIPELAAAVLCTVVRAPDPERVLDGLPCLLVAPGGAETLPAALSSELGARGDFTWVAGSEVPLLDELELPGLVERWLERR